jgi:putative tricarboxylic transport membrane protein
VRELGAALILLAAALGALVEAWRLPLGRVVAPGPGFFPFALALALTLTAALLVVRALRQPAGAGAAAPAPPGGRARLVTVVAALFAYAAVLGWLGFGLATFGLMAVLFRAVEARGWPTALGAAAAAAVAGHLLFRTWLGVRLPSGPWGF